MLEWAANASIIVVTVLIGGGFLVILGGAIIPPFVEAASAALKALKWHANAVGDPPGGAAGPVKDEP